MLDYIKGQIAELNPAQAVIDVNGLGFDVNISLATYQALQEASNSEAVKVLVYEAIREDAHLLYGFATQRERELFLLLITVSGVGPNTARLILSSVTVGDLENAIATDNVALLKSVKGIGAKTAQRIIVDLRDKIKTGSSTLLDNKGVMKSDTFDEALAALTMLGFSAAASQKALKKLFASKPDIQVEDAIKQALKMM